MIEARAYGPELSDEERREILGRVTVHAPGLILYRELPVQSPFTIALLNAQLDALTSGRDDFVYVLDLMNIKRPDAESRAMLRRCVAKVVRRVRHLSIAVGGNVLISAMAKLLAYGMGYRSVSIHPNVEEALAEAERVIAS